MSITILSNYILKIYRFENVLWKWFCKQWAMWSFSVVWALITFLFNILTYHYIMYARFHSIIYRNITYAWFHILNYRNIMYDWFYILNYRNIMYAWFNILNYRNITYVWFYILNYLNIKYAWFNILNYRNITYVWLYILNYRNTIHTKCMYDWMLINTTTCMSRLKQILVISNENERMVLL